MNTHEWQRNGEPATPAQRETYYQDLAALLAHELTDLIEEKDLSERATKLLAALDWDKHRQAYNQPLTYGRAAEIARLYEEVFIDPFIPTDD